MAFSRNASPSLRRIGCGFGVFMPAALLLAPILYYSLTTPFGLIDDFSTSTLASRLDSATSFFTWFEMRFCDFSATERRYRPYWELYGAATWNVLGANAAAHHLARWALHFGAVLLFVAALRCFYLPRIASRDVADVTYRLLPAALMVYVWVFFPNFPVARLGPLEVHTVLFLGLCNWMAAFEISRLRKQARSSQIPGPKVIQYVLFCVGYVGLTLSKETNIGLSLWLITCYFALVLYVARGGAWRASLMISVPMVVVFLVSLSKIYAAYGTSGVGYESSFNAMSSLYNATFVLRWLSQMDTSALITAGFVMLCATLLSAMFISMRRRRLGGEFVFMLFLAGQFAAMFIMISASWAVTLRYWYPLIPVLSLLLAFAAKLLMEVLDDRRSRKWMTYAVVVFVVFFVSGNYYNFALQTLIQHSVRHVEDQVIEHIFELVAEGEHVVVENTGKEDENALLRLVGPFHERFHGRTGFTVHAEAPDGGDDYVLVTRKNLPDYEKVMTMTSRQEYLLLALAHKVAKVVQFGREPFVQVDGGVSYDSGRPVRWNIYDMQRPNAGMEGER